jgi:hypothetical protein
MKTYSTNALSEMFEVDRASATRALRDVPPDQEQTPGRLTYKVATFHRALEAHRLKNASNNDRAADGASDSASLTQARVRIALASAEAKERANRIASGEYVPAKMILDMLDPVFMTMREISLSMPGKVSDALASYALEFIDKALAAGRATGESLTNLRSITFGIISHEVKENLTALASPDSYIDAFRKFENTSLAPVMPDADEVTADKVTGTTPVMPDSTKANVDGRRDDDPAPPRRKSPLETNDNSDEIAAEITAKATTDE